MKQYLAVYRGNKKELDYILSSFPLFCSNMNLNIAITKLGESKAYGRSLEVTHL